MAESKNEKANYERERNRATEKGGKTVLNNAVNQSESGLEERRRNYTEQCLDAERARAIKK